MDKLYFVYVLRCKDDSLYCGITTDVERRIQQHNGQRKGGARYTCGRRPVTLAWKSMGVAKSFALRAETAFKAYPKVKKEKFIAWHAFTRGKFQKMMEAHL